MIQNEHQLTITKDHLKNFVSALLELIDNPIPENIDSILHKAEIDGIISKIKDFADDLNEYYRTKK